MNPISRSVGRRRLHAAALAFAVALAQASTASELVPLPEQPAAEPWPTRDWADGPLPEALDRDAFDASVEQLFAAKGRGGFADTRAVLIVRGGRLVFERYAEGFGPESRFQSWSMAKSVTNALTGILVGQGRLALDARAPVSEWDERGDARREITLRQLLQMRSGLDNADGFDDGQDMTRSFLSRMMFGEGSSSPGAYAANVALIHPIGSHWAYSTGTSILIARICGERIGGGMRATRDFLRERLFDPIGMRSAQPEFARSGEFLGGVYVHATARDWARFGYLYLRDGVWDGQRILPEGWVDFSRTPNPASNNRVHGAHFWVNERPLEGSQQWQPLPGAPASVFLAEGAGFQIVAIDPAKDLVAVRLGLDQGTPYPEIKEPFGPLISAFPDRR